ncbi:MAG TPA: hypothetical protein VFE12_04320 [Acetobacteraceae bacterium]|jgi:hypothetical protein|nr:hypothetical protein [Acetobacteraceae bacterium]
MSNEISVKAVGALPGSSESGTESRTSATTVPQLQAAVAASPVINPTLRLDPALGLVVIEFHNDSGTLTTSIPSQRQIQAYQRWETTQLGPAPAGKTQVKPQTALPSSIETAEAKRPKAD